MRRSTVAARAASVSALKPPKGRSATSRNSLRLPLSEFEEALLVAAGFGVTGIPLWDASRPPAFRGGDGRTFGSTAHGRRTALFFTNDAGTHVIGPPGRNGKQAARGREPRMSAQTFWSFTSSESG